MLPLLFGLLLILAINGEVHYCCIGTKSNVTTTITSLFSAQCPTGDREYCFSLLSQGTTYYSCAIPAINTTCSLGVCCYSDNCNCPSDGSVHKTLSNLYQSIGDMKRMMLPILGVLFSVLYVIVAFFRISHIILFYIVVLTDIILGIFLIFIASTVYLGLAYIALGVCAILGTKTSKLRIILVICAFLLFLYTGGLTIIGFPTNYINIIRAYANGCQGDLNLINWDNTYWNLDTRCENYTLFVVFCVFVLFLMQPLYILLAFMMDGSGKKDDDPKEVALEDHYVKAVG